MLKRGRERGSNNLKKKKFVGRTRVVIINFYYYRRCDRVKNRVCFRLRLFLAPRSRTTHARVAICTIIMTMHTHTHMQDTYTCVVNIMEINSSDLPYTGCIPGSATRPPERIRNTATSRGCREIPYRESSRPPRGGWSQVPLDSPPPPPPLAIRNSAVQSNNRRNDNVPFQKKNTRKRFDGQWISLLAISIGTFSVAGRDIFSSQIIIMAAHCPTVV